MKLTLGQIADWIHAEGDFDDEAEVVGYSIDSRTIGVGDLFFAVKGERMDGHDYVERCAGRRSSCRGRFDALAAACER